MSNPQAPGERSAAEPSMEEILASIRRIIADDHEGSGANAAPAASRFPATPSASHDDEDVLDLAEVARTTPPVSRPTLVPEAEARVETPPKLEAVEPAPVAPEPFVPEPELTWDEEPTSAFEPAPVAPVIAIRPTLSEFSPQPAMKEAPPVSQPVVPPAIVPETSEPIETLVSNEAMASVGHAFSMLSHTILTQNARTLEDLVKDMLKPMLKTWLDDNLPAMVERLIRAEIERVARGR